LYGVSDSNKDGLAYLIDTKLGYAKTGYKAVKGVHKGIMNAILDKPQLTITWKNGLKNLKKGNFEAASKDFKSLNEQVDRTSVKKVENPS